MEQGLGVLPAAQDPHLARNPSPQHHPSRGHLAHVDAQVRVNLYSLMETHVHLNHAGGFDAHMSVNTTSPFEAQMRVNMSH